MAHIVNKPIPAQFAFLRDLFQHTTWNQADLVLATLIERRKVTADELRTYLEINDPAARIRTLQKMGYVISSRRSYRTGRWGQRRLVTTYYYIREGVVI